MAMKRRAHCTDEVGVRVDLSTRASVAVLVKVGCATGR